MSANDLTTLASVKAWLGITDTGSDALLKQLIGRASGLALGYLGRASLGAYTFTENYDGRAGCRLMLRNRPVIAINSFQVGNVTIPASTNPPYGGGYYLDPWSGLPPGRLQGVVVQGYSLLTVKSGIKVSYVSGYVQVNEVWTIPATPYQITPLVPYGVFAADYSVNFVGGAPLTPIASGTPNAGQYVPPTAMGSYPNSPVVYYLFAAADAGKQVQISYSYIPSQVEGAVCEWVGERYRYKERIGLKSQSQGGNEATTFDISGVPQIVKAALDPYKQLVPVL